MRDFISQIRLILKHKWVQSVAIFAYISFSGIGYGADTYISGSATTGEYTAIPPFVEQSGGRPSVVLAFDVSGSMLAPAYQTNTSSSGLRSVQEGFSPGRTYFGYFKSGIQYSYDTVSNIFIEAGPVDISGSTVVPLTPGNWDGDFLNWMTMRRVDVAREVMVGGKVRNRNGEIIRGTTYFVKEGEYEVNDNDWFKKKSSVSANYSPVPNDTEIEIKDQKISFTGGSQVNQTSTAITDNLEIGYVSVAAWEAGFDNDRNKWPSITFNNAYNTPPIVVATHVTYDGANATIARAADITSTGAKIALQEWDWRDGGHIGEYIFYIVAEEGQHTISLDGGSSVKFSAGSVNTDKTLGDGNGSGPSGAFTNNDGISQLFGPSTLASPIVFHGVSSMAEAIDRSDSDPSVVNSRIFDKYASGFEVVLQEQETSNTSPPSHTVDEDIHWVAIESTSGPTETVGGVPFEVGSLSASTGGETLTFENTYSAKPLLALSIQSANDGSAASVRLGASGTAADSAWSTTSAPVAIQNNEEASHADETVGYLVTVGTDGLHIKVASTNPKDIEGVVQANQNNINFGLSVFNYDHAKSYNNIVNGNTVDGQTMHPCYPIYDEGEWNNNARWSNHVTNDPGDPDMEIVNHLGQDFLCTPTPVHAPLDKIVQVIEEYPMIWGTTPIAETLVDIGRYMKQKPPYYQHATNGGSNDPRPIYQLNNNWDPYYDATQGADLECKQVFSLHFNDGEPFKDFDGNGHPSAASDIYTSSPLTYADKKAVDNVALALRFNDGRPDLIGHQELISYYVFADLADAGNSGSLTEMRQAALAGGFDDKDGDHLPDNYNNIIDGDGNSYSYDNINAYANYVKANPGKGKSSEWDSDADGEPDTFFYVSDGNDLEAKISAALKSITDHAATGGASAVVSATAAGEGAVYQSIFNPSLDTVTWVGDVYGLFVDSDGLLREDSDGDAVLDSSDGYVSSCYDSVSNPDQVRVNIAATKADVPSASVACTATTYDKSMSDVKHLWSASDQLNLANTADEQRSYTAIDSSKRYIIVGIDDPSSPNGNIASSEVVDFTANSFTTANIGLLNHADLTEAHELVNWVRGEENSNRNRTGTSGEVYRLGDIIYSTATAVGRPAENIDLIYNDPTYASFIREYFQRRTVVYAGSNGGLLHAFNAGYYDKNGSKFEKGYMDKSSPPVPANNHIQWNLGQELWAYIPYHVLPHLKYLADGSYGSGDGDHIYTVDGTPRVFDARIFNNSTVGATFTGGIDGQAGAEHPHGWGTVMVVGMRQGGGSVTVDKDQSAAGDQTFVSRSSYSIFDITNPDVAPKLLLEYSHPDLGLTFAQPSPLSVKRAGSTVETASDPAQDWYLLIPSGPSNSVRGVQRVQSDQHAKLFLLNLKTLRLEATFGSAGIMDIGETDSFSGDPIVVDYELDLSSDAIYFGTSKGVDTSTPLDGYHDDWEGKIFRLLISRGSTAPTFSLSEIYDPNLPVVTKPNISIDDKQNKWLYFGTGRFYTKEDSGDTTTNHIYGFKEPRNLGAAGAPETWGVIDPNKLVTVTDVVVEDDTGAISGAVLPGMDSDPSIKEFDEIMTQTDDVSKYTSGWVRELGQGTVSLGSDTFSLTGERVTGQPTVFGGIYTQTSFRPNITDPCDNNGVSVIYALRYTTGTAWQDSFIGPPVSGKNIPRLAIGRTPASSPALHTGSKTADGTISVFIQNADTSTTILEEENVEGATSKETSWREF